MCLIISRTIYVKPVLTMKITYSGIYSAKIWDPGPPNVIHDHASLIN